MLLLISSMLMCYKGIHRNALQMVFLVCGNIVLELISEDDRNLLQFCF